MVCRGQRTTSTFTGVIRLTWQVLFEPSHQLSPHFFLCMYVCGHVRGACVRAGSREHMYMGGRCKSQVFLLTCYPQDLTCK